MQAPAPTLELRDIHLPDPISWWPLAPGWWLLLLGLILLILTGIAIKKIYARKRINRASLTELEKIRQDYLQHQNKATLVRAISILMRRACLSFYPRSSVSDLTGEHWLSYLDSTARKKGFLQGEGKILADAPYLPENHFPEINSDALLALCEAWLRAQPAKGVSR